MYQPEAYWIALVFTVISMMCWGSWANTTKLTPGWPFPLFYWDYVIGIILGSLFWGITLGMHGQAGISFFSDIAQADSIHIVFAMLGGAVFNIANLLLVAAIDIADSAMSCWDDLAKGTAPESRGRFFDDDGSDEATVNPPTCDRCCVPDQRN